MILKLSYATFSLFELTLFHNQDPEGGNDILPSENNPPPPTPDIMSLESSLLRYWGNFPFSRIL